MAIYRRPTLSFALGCLVLFCFGSSSAATSGTAEHENDGSSGVLSIAERQLLQVTKACPHQFAFDNFTSLEGACPHLYNNDTTNYPKKACCNALADMLCPYQAFFNDPNSQCAASYWSTLELATDGEFNQEFFQNICTDITSPRGLPCTSGPSPAPNQSSAKRG